MQENPVMNVDPSKLESLTKENENLKLERGYLEKQLNQSMAQANENKRLQELLLGALHNQQP